MSSPICKFFKSEQGCKFGNKCRYRHSDPSHLPTSNQSSDHFQRNGPVSYNRPEASYLYQQEYLDFSTGERRNGASVTCRPIIRNPRFYRDHPAPSSISSYSTHHEYPVSFDTSSTTSEGHLQNKLRDITTDQNEEAVTANKGLHQPQQRTTTSSTRKLCRYFVSHGNCCFGSRCRFEHASPHGNRIPPRFQQNNASNAGSKTDRNLSSRSYGSKTEEQKWVKNSMYSTREKTDSPVGTGSPALTSVDSLDAKGTEDNASSSSSTSRDQHRKSEKICQFYTKRKCWRGKQCRFVHPNDQTKSAENNLAAKAQHKKSEKDLQPESENSNSAGSQNKVDEPLSNSAVQKERITHLAQGLKKYARDEVDEAEGCRLRRTEIDILVKRFPKGNIKVNRDCADYFQSVVCFSPTDPDWPYDVKIFQLQVDIPSDYPFEMLSISLPVEQDLPETVRRYMEVSIEEWLEARERQLADNRQVEMVFRPFFRWLDRNIEDVVTKGLQQMKREMMAKAAGLEFISVKQLQKQYQGQTCDNAAEDDDDDDDDGDNDSDNDDSTSGSQDEDSSSEYDDGEDDDDREGENEKEGSKGQKRHLDRVKAMMAEPERKGTEISLKNLQFKDNASTLYFEKLCLSIQCERCKGRWEFFASCGRVNMIQCGQCSQTQIATFRPAMGHQFASVIGYLDLEGCRPLDVILQNCNAVISCLHCSKESKLGAVLPGQPQDQWCRVCHHKLRIATDGARFTQLEPSKVVQSLRGSVKVVVPSRKRISKDPAIQEGKPLPNFGACKHYKKSYRWLRFPCCGKCYPCDVCHDSKEDHEMKFANRMICGFCCKEQVFAAEKPCKGCDMNMTKVHTKHWEGGQGCRDKITMSKNDKQKHRNINKTVSKHAQKVKDMQSKKRTKLRHT